MLARLPRSSTKILRSLLRSPNLYLRPTSSSQSSDSNINPFKKIQSNQFLEHSSDVKNLLSSLGVDYLEGSVPIVDRPTKPGEYAISRARYDNIYKHTVTEEEMKEAGKILEEAARSPKTW